MVAIGSLCLVVACGCFGQVLRVACARVCACVRVPVCLCVPVCAAVCGCVRACGCVCRACPGRTGRVQERTDAANESVTRIQSRRKTDGWRRRSIVHGAAADAQVSVHNGSAAPTVARPAATPWLQRVRTSAPSAQNAFELERRPGSSESP